MKLQLIVPTIITLVVIGTPLAFGIHQPSIDNDMDSVTVEILDTQILFMDDTAWDYLDNSDLVKITIKVTNENLDYFLLNDKMIKLWAMEPDFRTDSLELVDNYATIYDDELEVIFDNFQSRELFEECDWINERVRIGESKEITVCYNVLRIWNNEVLTLDGTKQYYLVMMNNHQASSCPNCKKIPVSSEGYLGKEVPKWIQNLSIWYSQGRISEQDFLNSIDYLTKTGIIDKITNGKQLSSVLENKNLQLKEHQVRLSLAEQKNLYVSAMNFYESRNDESFSGVTCKRQNNIVTFSGDFKNEDTNYDSIFFKLLVFDAFEDVVATGLSKIVDVTPNDFRHISVSTPYDGEINSCFVMVDSKFQ